jgi:hypothetical protein
MLKVAAGVVAGTVAAVKFTVTPEPPMAMNTMVTSYAFDRDHGVCWVTATKHVSLPTVLTFVKVTLRSGATMVSVRAALATTEPPTVTSTWEAKEKARTRAASTSTDTLNTSPVQDMELRTHEAAVVVAEEEVKRAQEGTAPPSTQGALVAVITNCPLLVNRWVAASRVEPEGTPSRTPRYTTSPKAAVASVDPGAMDVPNTDRDRDGVTPATNARTAVEAASTATIAIELDTLPPPSLSPPPPLSLPDKPSARSSLSQSGVCLAPPTSLRTLHRMAPRTTRGRTQGGIGISCFEKTHLLQRLCCRLALRSKKTTKKKKCRETTLEWYPVLVDLIHNTQPCK